MAGGKVGRKPTPDDQKRKCITIYVNQRNIEILKEKGINLSNLVDKLLTEHMKNL